jgi:hypothetical protein
MIRIPVCFSSEILDRRDKERDHGPCAYCYNFNCLALSWLPARVLGYAVRVRVQAQ